MKISLRTGEASVVVDTRAGAISAYKSVLEIATLSLAAHDDMNETIF